MKREDGGGPLADVSLESGAPSTRFSAAALFEDLDEQWPSLKYLGFGLYYAWIFLCYNSDVLYRWPGVTVANDTLLSMYLLSTSAISVVLVVAGFFQEPVRRMVESRASVLVMALVASVATFMVSAFAGEGARSMGFVLGSLLTGMGTAFVALRLGSVYSGADARQAFMYTAGSFIFAGMMYFVVVGIPHPASLVLVTALPLVAVAFTMAAMPKLDPFADDVVPLRELPHGYFMRLMIAITVFSIITGVVKGIMSLAQPLAAVPFQGSIIVFATGCAAVFLFLFVGLLVRDFDISQLYYPIIILACFGDLVVPLFGGIGPVQGAFVSIAYNLFIMMVWCLLANVANRTDVSYVRVFGWGRGASAAGTTIGWFVGSMMNARLVENPSDMVALSMAMVFVLMVVSMVILNERTIGLALRKTESLSKGAGDMPSKASMLEVPEGTGILSGTDEDGSGLRPREGTWRKRCSALADEAGLSARERDVLFLLGKGRTIEYVANELGISFNTAKSHIRNVYTKTGVHSKQELQSLIEECRER